MTDRDTAPAQTELETLWREGRPEAALDAAQLVLASDPLSLEARLVAGLAWLDLGNPGEARALLAGYFDATASAGDRDNEIADVELDSAFAEATALTDQIIDANQLAEAATRAVDGDRPEGIDRQLLPDERFETPTMASLLERQGLAGEAAEIRSSMRSREIASSSTVLETLERWLLNIRRAYR